MNHLLSKKQVNNQKSCLFDEKIAKSLTTFRKNKPNLSEDKYGAKHFSTRIYERFHPLAGRKNKPNQTQNKANSNPIAERAKMNVNIYQTKVYNNKTAFRRKKTNPIQTQFEPNFSTRVLYVNE